MYKIKVLLNVGFNIILHCCKKRTALKLILNIIFKIAVCHTYYMLNWLYMHSLCKDPFNSTESSTLSEEPRWVILNLPAMYYIRSILLLCDMEFLPKLKETTEKWRPFCRRCTVFRFKRRKVDVTANLGYAPCMAAPVSHQSAVSLTEILKSLCARPKEQLATEQPRCTVQHVSQVE